MKVLAAPYSVSFAYGWWSSVGGEGFREPVHGGRGRGHDPAHTRLQSGLDHVVGAVDHHLEGDARFRGALGDPQRCLVEDDVDVAGQLVHQLAVADVALDQPHRAVGQRPGEVLPPAADEVVEHHHLPRPRP